MLYPTRCTFFQKFGSLGLISRAQWRNRTWAFWATFWETQMSLETWCSVFLWCTEALQDTEAVRMCLLRGISLGTSWRLELRPQFLQEHGRYHPTSLILWMRTEGCMLGAGAALWGHCVHQADGDPAPTEMKWYRGEPKTGEITVNSERHKGKKIGRGRMMSQAQELKTGLWAGKPQVQRHWGQSLVHRTQRLLVRQVREADRQQIMKSLAFREGKLGVKCMGDGKPLEKETVPFPVSQGH